MEKHELYSLLAKKEEEFDKAKGKRSIITIFAFAIAFFCAIFLVEQPTGFEIVGIAFVSIFIAGIHFFVNALVFSILFRKGEAEKKILESIKKEISEIEEQ